MFSELHRFNMRTSCAIGFTWLQGNDLHLVENVRRVGTTEHDSLASYLRGGMEVLALNAGLRHLFTFQTEELRGSRRGKWRVKHHFPVSSVLKTTRVNANQVFYGTRWGLHHL